MLLRVACGHSSEWDVDHQSAGGGGGLQHQIHGLRGRHPHPQDHPLPDCVRVPATPQPTSVDMCGQYVTIYFSFGLILVIFQFSLLCTMSKQMLTKYCSSLNSKFRIITQILIN